MNDQSRDAYQARVEATAQMLLTTVRELGMQISGDHRVSEADAAALIGVAAGSLKNLRAEGGAPDCYRAGINGCRVSYRLFDLAAWLEARRNIW